MGKQELSGRDTWQDYSGENAGHAEKSFFTVLTQAFNGTDLRIREKPREFKNIYNAIELPEAVLKQIFNPPRDYTHGIIPDYAIDNVRLDKHLYVEVKRQDGWVEGKEMSAGRGNAHERSCKLFTPGLLKVMRSYGHLGDDVLPFWVVFQGDIARDPKRNREIHCWYQGVEQHFFMWTDSTNADPLLYHFNTYLRPLLMGDHPAVSLKSAESSIISSPQVSQPLELFREKSSIRS